MGLCISKGTGTEGHRETRGKDAGSQGRRTRWDTDDAGKTDTENRGTQDMDGPRTQRDTGHHGTQRDTGHGGRQDMEVHGTRGDTGHTDLGTWILYMDKGNMDTKGVWRH